MIVFFNRFPYINGLNNTDLYLESTESTRQLPLADNGLAMSLFGKGSENIKKIEALTGVKLDTRGSVVILRGSEDKVAFAAHLLTELYSLLEKGFPLTAQDLNYAVSMLSADPETELSKIFMDTVYTSYKK